MLEVYLFINPLGNKSFRTAQEIHSILNDNSRKMKLRLLPLLNFQTITNFMQTSGYSVCNLNLRNQLFKQAYRIALDFTAASFQGKKLGIRFLLALQDKLNVQQQNYSPALASEVANLVGLDVVMFEEDRISQLAKQQLQKAQQLAAQMNVVSTPSTVIDQPDTSVLVQDTSAASFIAQVVSGQTDLKQAILANEVKPLRYLSSHQ